jgi:predicted CopG family antitoxin
MSRKLTISVSEEVYQGLYRTVGRRRISQFLEKLARPHVLSQDLEAAYRDMAADREREHEALAWSEGLIRDIGNEPDVAR